jgi:hypothetical protein
VRGVPGNGGGANLRQFRANSAYSSGLSAPIHPCRGNRRFPGMNWRNPGFRRLLRANSAPIPRQIIDHEEGVFEKSTRTPGTSFRCPWSW